MHKPTVVIRTKKDLIQALAAYPDDCMVVYGEYRNGKNDYDGRIYSSTVMMDIGSEPDDPQPVCALFPGDFISG